MHNTEEQQMEGPGRSPPRKKGLRGFLGDLAEFAETVGNVVQSAGELLLDTELRKKGASMIAQQAEETINEVQREFEARAERVQQGARARIGAGAQKLQSVLRNIERQIQDFQRQQQQWDLQAELEHHHKLPVDIQVGDQVYEDMPQEMRTRLWYVLLQRPDLASGLTRRGIRRMSESASFESSRRTAHAAQAHLSAAAEAEEDSTAPVHHVTAEAAAAAVAAAMGDTIEDLNYSRQGSATEPTTVEAAEDDAGSATATPAEATTVCALGEGQATAPAMDSGGKAGSPFAAYCTGATPMEAPEFAAAVPPAEAAAPAADVTTAAAADAEAASSSEAAAGEAAVTPAAVAAAAAATGGGTANNTATGAAAAQVAATQAGAAGHYGQPTNNTSTDDALYSDDMLAQQLAGEVVEQQAAAAAGDNSAHSSSIPSSGGSVGGAVAVRSCDSSSGDCAAVSSAPSAPSPWMSVQHAASNASSFSIHPVAPSPWEHSAAGNTVSRSRQHVAAAATSLSATGDGDAGWELVPDDVPSDLHQFTEDVETLDNLRSLVLHLMSADSLDASRACQAAVFQAMLNEVPWLDGEGVPPEVDPNGEYAKFLEAGCGSIEDIIVRDVPRTFPEHPLFSCHEGQQRLLRLLKAYAAADPEVGYCQGMAFAAGILLMYLPEEPAFRLYHRLMTSGPTLRRLYMPGLDFLKMELSRFELLLSTHTPQLHQHLLDSGLPALLYAAQWLMTCYACPFPVHVAARVLDILLQSDDASILLRLGLAVITALQDQLLELDDFEELITYLKVKPLSWPVQMHRKVLNDAMNSPASDAELAAGTAAVQAEFQRLGRFSSFSSCQLRPLQLSASCGESAVGVGNCNGGSSISTGRVRHELVPGPMGPRTAAAAAAAEAEEQAAKASNSNTSNEGQDSSSSQAADQPPQLSQQQQPAAAVAGTAESGVLGELDATLIDLMADMDLAPRSESDDSQTVGTSA